MSKKQHLRARRDAAGVSLQKIANATGLAVQTVQRAFATGDVSDVTLAKIEAALAKAVERKQSELAKLNAAEVASQ